MKGHASSLLTLLYCLFTLLYTLYLAGHPGNFGPSKWDDLFYHLKFLLIDGYLFFIGQGLLLRSKNWGVLLLLPPAILVASIVALFLMVGILRLGGGTLLDHDDADRIAFVLCWLTGSCLSLRWIKTGKKARKK